MGIVGGKFRKNRTLPCNASKTNLYMDKFITLFRKYWTEILIFFGLGISILSIGLYYNTFKSFHGLAFDTGTWGTFGDYIGGVLGTIFSFFGVILIYATYKNQVATTLLQQFETTFFTLLQNQREILKSLKGEFKTFGFMPNLNSIEISREHGDAYISAMALGIEENMESIDLEFTKTLEDHLVKINEIYDINYSGRKAELGHYFRHLYHIFKYTHESKLTNKKKYIDIIQAQMSNDELYIAFYNGLSEYGREKFFPLLNEYQFFENIGSKSEIFDVHAKLFYTNTKFKFLSDRK